MNPVGYTDAGRLVVDGVFRFVDEVGLPLELVKLSMDEKRMVISLPHFIADAMKAGWTRRAIASRLNEVYRNEAEFSEKLEKLLNIMLTL